MKKINNQGIIHNFVPIVFVVLVAVVGTYLLVASHADTPALQPTQSEIAAIDQKIKNMKIGPLVKVASPKGALLKLPQTESSTTSSEQILYSTNWSGYAAEGQVFNRVNGAIKVPAVKCTQADTNEDALAVFWVGFDGLATANVEQDGIWAACDSAKDGGAPVAIYGAWWEMYPSNNMQVMNLSVSQGDTIVMNVTYAAVGKGGYLFNVDDKTTGQVATAGAQCGSGYACYRSSAEWIAERPSYNSSLYLLINYGTVGLYGDVATASAPSSSSEPVGQYLNQPIDMTNSSNNLAQVSPLDQKNEAFTDQWLAAQ